MRSVAGLYMSLYTILGQERGRVHLVTGVNIPEFRACIPLFTPSEMSVHEHQDREHCDDQENDQGHVSLGLHRTIVVRFILVFRNDSFGKRVALPHRIF